MVSGVHQSWPVKEYLGAMRGTGLLHLESGHCLGLPCTEFNGGGTDLQATGRGMLEVIEPCAACNLEADHPQDELIQQGDSPLIRARSAPKSLPLRGPWPSAEETHHRQVLGLPNLLRQVLGLGNGIDLNNASKGRRGELVHVKLEAKLNDLTHLDAPQRLRQFLREAGKASHDIGQKDVKEFALQWVSVNNWVS